MRYTFIKTNADGTQEVVKHYGVLGMKWGVRKQRREYLKKGKQYGKTMNKSAGKLAQHEYDVDYYSRQKNRHNKKVSKIYAKGMSKYMKKNGLTETPNKIPPKLQKKLNKHLVKYEKALKGEQAAKKEWEKETKRLTSITNKAVKEGYKFKIKDAPRAVRLRGRDAVNQIVTSVAGTMVSNVGLGLAGVPLRMYYIPTGTGYQSGKKIKLNKKATLEGRR